MKALLTIFVTAFSLTAFAESAKETAHDAKRSAKKTVHRVEEKLCAEGDAKCAAKKAKHRATEGKDYVEDKVDEATDKK